MRYFLDNYDDGDWVIYLASVQGDPNGTVVLTLPGTLPREAAVRARIALARAREEGHREVAGNVTSFLRGLRW